MPTDQHIPSELIQKIREQNTEVLQGIYKEAYPMVEKYILDNSGSRDDAKDIFQDAMYLLIKKAHSKHFQLTSKISTYLFGISKNLWLKKLTQKAVDKKEYAAEMSYENLEEDEHIQLERIQHMKNAIDKLGEPCKTIIVQFYFLKTNMQEISEMLNYTNANNAKNQKYKCFVRLKKLMGVI